MDKGIPRSIIPSTKSRTEASSYSAIKEVVKERPNDQAGGRAGFPTRSAYRLTTCLAESPDITRYSMDSPGTENCDFVGHSLPISKDTLPVLFTKTPYVLLERRKGIFLHAVFESALLFSFHIC